MDQQTNKHNIQRVTVYASSSKALDPVYYDAAKRLGNTLAEAGMSVIYGGGGAGLMGAMADAALAGGAEVHGVIPHFLHEIEVGHTALTTMDIVDDMRIRKHRMLENTDAVVTLPGGSGTYEELFEAMTLKRLGQFLGPIVLVNTKGFYDRCLDFLNHSVEERFMADIHLDMWSVVDTPEEVIAALEHAPAWSEEARRFSAV